MNTTTWWLLSSISILIAYDVFALLHWGYRGTISYDVFSTSQNNPIIPFIVGIVAGHLFWSQTGK